MVSVSSGLAHKSEGSTSMLGSGTPAVWKELTPKVVTLRISEDDKETSYFGFRVRHMLSLRALGVERESYLQDLTRRHVEFLTCLMNPRDERFTYDLRIVTNPNPDSYTHGEITIGILCRIDGTSAEDAQRYGEDFLNLLGASFFEYVFEQVPAEEIKHLLSPFPVEYMVAITRRCANEPLDTLRSGPRRVKRLGFSPVSRTDGEADSSTSGKDTVFHIFPFLPSFATFNHLCKLLLLERSPIAVSCRLRPTVLSPDEEQFLEQQIATCERYSQVSLGQIPEDVSSLHPTLREQARMYQHYQARMLLEFVTMLR
jgi:hypothetical protein